MMCGGKALQCHIGLMSRLAMLWMIGESATNFTWHSFTQKNFVIASGHITQAILIAELYGAVNSVCPILTKHLKWSCFAEPGMCEATGGMSLP